MVTRSLDHDAKERDITNEVGHPGTKSLLKSKTMILITRVIICQVREEFKLFSSSCDYSWKFSPIEKL
ncbi:MAG: hypothetical protein ACFFBD_16750 [Candidatus Hodarchaeota archaeon]